ncbi:hypothetical protein LCGC14_2843550 [marine sediment metagenome]|uniref:Uncharacterized protein n=1 Tax=marine sediment metagenome TaxID=412755 RepID=A0A0F8YX85_9ZZZZ
MRSAAATCLAMCAAAAAAGCLEIDVHVQMHEDGTATVTERTRFSAALLDLDRHVPGEKLQALGQREAIAKRARQMGKGVRLTSHKLTTLKDGGQESVTVFTVPNIEDLRLVNPYLHQAAPGRVMRLRFVPIYRRVHSFHKVGDLMMYLVPAATPKRRGSQPDKPPPKPTPLDLQVLRDLQPMLLDVLKGFRISLRLELPKPISRAPVRDRRAATKVITLISFTDKDLDAHGRRFLVNEEIMLSLLRRRFADAVITRHVREFTTNKTLPVFRGDMYGIGRFRIKPTEALFRKYYAGRPKSQGGDR